MFKIPSWIGQSLPWNGGPKFYMEFWTGLPKPNSLRPGDFRLSTVRVFSLNSTIFDVDGTTGHSVSVFIMTFSGNRLLGVWWVSPFIVSSNIRLSMLNVQLLMSNIGLGPELIKENNLSFAGRFLFMQLSMKMVSTSTFPSGSQLLTISTVQLPICRSNRMTQSN